MTHLQLGQHARRFFLARADAPTGRRRARRRGEKLFENEVETKKSGAGVDELADHRAVFGDAVAEALVGHVEEGDQAALP